MTLKMLSPYCGFTIIKSCLCCSNQSSHSEGFQYDFQPFIIGLTDADHNFNKQIQIQLHQISFL